MGSFKNNVLSLNSDSVVQEELMQFCESYGLKVEKEIRGAAVCYEECDDEKLDEIFTIANKLFRDVYLCYEESEGNSGVDWYSGYEVIYNENSDGKKQTKTYNYCDSDFEANGINGWEILRDTIEEKAQKKNIEICWAESDELYPDGDYGDEFYDFCENILEKKGGLKGLSTKKNKTKIRYVSIDDEYIQQISYNAKEFGYNSLVDKIKKEFGLEPCKFDLSNNLKQKKLEKNPKKKQKNKTRKSSASLDEEKIEKQIFKLLNEEMFLFSVEEWCESHDKMEIFEKLLKKKEFMLAAIDEHPDNFADYGIYLDDDEEIVLRAITRSGYNLKCASDRLKNDRNFIKIVFEKSGAALKYALEKFKSDKELVKIAVQNYGRAFEFASEDLRADKELAMLAVQNDGSAFEFVSEDLKNDKDVVAKAIANDPSACKYVGEMKN